MRSTLEWTSQIPTHKGNPLKIEEAEVQAVTSDNFKTIAFQVDNKMAQILFRDKLYTEAGKLRVIAQEYMANARDAHRAAGKSDTPIEVTLPTSLAPEFVVRDFGKGIPPNIVEDIFCVYGASTKKESNDQNGGYGIGAKCAFSYVKAFSVTTTCEGIRYIYAGSVNGNNTNDFVLMDQGPAAGPDGTEIRIPIRSQDIRTLHNWVAEVTHSWTPRPTLVNQYVNYNTNQPIATGDRWQLYEGCRPTAYNNSWYGITVTADDIPYVMTEDQAKEISAETEALHTLLREHNMLLVLNFKIGEVTIPPQRESIDLTARTKDNIAKAVDLFIHSQIASAEAKLAAATDVLGRIELSFRKDHDLLVARSFGTKQDDVLIGAEFDPEEAGMDYYTFRADRRRGGYVFSDAEQQGKMKLKNLVKVSTDYGHAGVYAFEAYDGKYNVEAVKKMIRGGVYQSGTVRLFIIKDPAKFKAKTGADPKDLTRFNVKFFQKPPKVYRPRPSRPASIYMTTFEAYISGYSTAEVTYSHDKKLQVFTNDLFDKTIFVEYKEDTKTFLYKNFTMTEDEMAKLLLVHQNILYPGSDRAHVALWNERYEKYVDFDEVKLLEDDVTDSMSALRKSEKTLVHAAFTVLTDYKTADVWPLPVGNSSYLNHGFDKIMAAAGYSEEFTAIAADIFKLESLREPYGDDVKKLKVLRQAYKDVFEVNAGSLLTKRLQDDVARYMRVRDELSHLFSHSTAMLPLLCLAVGYHECASIRLNGDAQGYEYYRLVIDRLTGFKPKNQEFAS